MSLSFTKTITICSIRDVNLEASISRGKSYAQIGFDSPAAGVETVKDDTGLSKSTKPSKILDSKRFLGAMSQAATRHLSLMQGVGNCQRLIGISPHRAFGRLGKLQ